MAGNDIAKIAVGDSLKTIVKSGEVPTKKGLVGTLFERQSALIQYNQLDPNSPNAKELKVTLDSLNTVLDKKLEAKPPLYY